MLILNIIILKLAYVLIMILYDSGFLGSYVLNVF